MKKQHGFSLIELMIVVAIIAIIAAVALPSYRESVIASQRTVAKSALMDVSSRQEQYKANNKRYAASLTDLGFPATYYVDQAGQSTAANGIYQITLGNLAAFTFTATATPLGVQARDDDTCGVYTYNEMGQKTFSKGGSADECW
jgi:type IV pilus assembly protein PilE